MNPLYIPWIRHWAGNRTMKIRHNARLDPTEYTVNNGIPQGPPLSPFLFGAYIKKLTDPRIIATANASRLVISYVDDVLLCRSSSNRLPSETWPKKHGNPYPSMPDQSECPSPTTRLKPCMTAKKHGEWEQQSRTYDSWDTGSKNRIKRTATPPLHTDTTFITG